MHEWGIFSKRVCLSSQILSSPCGEYGRGEYEEHKNIPKMKCEHI